MICVGSRALNAGTRVCAEAPSAWPAVRQLPRERHEHVKSKVDSSSIELPTCLAIASA